MGILSLCFRGFPSSCRAPSTATRTHILSSQTRTSILDVGHHVPTFPLQFATTETYNYHPPLPLSVSDPEAPEQSLGDCSICMEAIHADDPKPLQHVAAGLLQKVGGRKNYSLAPCHHLFVRAPSICVLFDVTHSSPQHTDCLEKWLAIKVSMSLIHRRWHG